MRHWNQPMPMCPRGHELGLTWATASILVITTVAVAMALQGILARAGLLTIWTTSLVWVLAGWLAASAEPNWQVAARCTVAAATIGGLMALTIQTVTAASPVSNRWPLDPLGLLFAETLCRTLLCAAAGVFGCLAVVAMQTRWRRSARRLTTWT